MNTIKRLVASTLAALFLVGLMGTYSPAQAQQIWIDCKPNTVAVYYNRIHMRCTNQTVFFWYGVTETPTNRDFLNRVLTLANTAVTTGKSVKLLYDTTKSKNDWREVVGIELFQ